MAIEVHQAGRLDGVRQVGRRIAEALHRPTPTAEDKLKNWPSVNALFEGSMNSLMFRVLRDLATDFGDQAKFWEGDGNRLSLSVSHEQITTSQHLPDELRDYMEAPSANEEFSEYWVNPHIWVVAHRARLDGIPSNLFQIGLGMDGVTKGVDSYGVNISGYVADHGYWLPPHCTIPLVHISPFGFKWSNTELYTSVLKPAYDRLNEYAEKDTSPGKIGRALVGLTLDTLRTNLQAQPVAKSA